MKKGVVKSVLFTVFLLIIFSLSVFAASINVTKEKLDFKGTKIKISSDVGIYKLNIYKKAANGKFILFYQNKTENMTSLEVFIPREILSTSSKTEIVVVGYDKDGNRISGNHTIDPLPSPVPINPSETATPSYSPTPVPTKPTPSTSTSTSPSTSSSPSTSPSTSTDPSIQPTSIKLNKDALTLTIGGTTSATLKATVDPSNADQTVTWTSSKPEIAKVDNNGKVVAVKKGSATITATTKNGKKAICKVTVKLKTISKTLNTGNCKSLGKMDTAEGCNILQSLCVTPNYYVVNNIKSGNSKCVVSTVKKNSTKVVHRMSGNFYHANGATYNPDDKCVYITHMTNKKVSKINESNLTSGSLSRKILNFPASNSGIAYDSYTKRWVLKSGTSVNIYNKELNKKLKNFSVVKHTGQDCGVYKGLMLSIDYVGGGNNDIHIYNILTGEHYGKYHITLSGELESVDYDETNKCFVMGFNSGGTKLYTTTSINLDKYVPSL